MASFLLLLIKRSKKMKNFFFLLSLMVTLMLAADTPKEVHVENDKIEGYSERVATLYHLEDTESIKDITDQILASSDTKDSAKESIIKYQRRIYVFKYPSEGLSVYGFISFTPNHVNHPLEILFRGGNQTFGLLNPGDPLATYQDDTVISSVLRGGISEGKDEFGVGDLADIKNLMEYIPSLEEKLQIKLQPSSVFALGESRGGMEMFLALAKYPELQNKFDKIVSLSGLLDMNKLINEREDMKEMFIKDFGFRPGENDQEWIEARNPLSKANAIKKSLPVLIIQGTQDKRVTLNEGRNMVEKLEQNGHAVTYWEIDGGDHTLTNTLEVQDRIAEWINN
jgi:predicted esterase